jgi:hypothetical protein
MKIILHLQNKLLILTLNIKFINNFKYFLTKSSYERF